eukprot:TRINITY_DN8319_c0_g1_i1.p1 TRINITY_DN8319_c0_g1~~TRINITY_DN8319_c0_g1_i1.p1  ORF type:complete len:108 (-),score=13.16 TRINITY_DN8319_c0_g1_i1:64-387(-)
MECLTINLLTENNTSIIGPHTFCFYKPILIGPLTVLCWKSKETRKKEEFYGLQIFENGRRVIPKRDTRFQSDVLNPEKFESLRELVVYLHMVTLVFPGEKAVPLEYY